MENEQMTQVTQETVAQTELNNQKEIKKEINQRKAKRRVGKVIGNIIATIIFLVLIFEAGIGILNMQRINDEKEPIWYLSTNTEETSTETKTIYNLGLYKIVKTDTSKKTTVSLKPFFMN